jgi:MFS family permease
VYVAGLIAALLVLGALSDHIGRRPVLGAAVALEAVALVLFLAAGDVSVLLAAGWPRASRPGRRSPPWAPRWWT